MTLVLTALAAVAVAVLRFAKPAVGVKWHLGVLALMYFGASLMWCVDGIASLVEGGSFVELADQAVVLDDSLLGLSVIALGLVVWSLALLFLRRKAAIVGRA
jgi:hypothetical protein